MKTKRSERVSLVEVLVFLLGGTGLIGVLALDKLYFVRSVFAEGKPDFSAEYIGRSVVTFLFVVVMFWSLVGRDRLGMRLNGGAGVPVTYPSILSSLFIAVVVVGLFVFKPTIFSSLSLEDNIIEWASAMLLFGSCMVVVISFLKIRNVSSAPIGSQLTLALFAIAFFVMAMEEVSWFQRVLEIETPESFSSNLQNEMNFHNFYTDKIENIYYFGSFLFLVFLPFVRSLFSYVSNNRYLRMFVARPFVAIIGAIACAYNYDMWNIIFSQIAFFGSVLILSAFFIATSHTREKYFALSTIILVIATQSIFLANGDNFSRIWEVTEYKEFFIALALFVYSLDLLTRINQAPLQNMGKS